MGGGGRSPAPTSACVFCCDSKGAFSSHVEGFWHFLMCDRKGSLRRGERSLLRPCCDLGAAARDAVGGDRGSVLTSMPGFPGGPSGPGAPGSPLVPFKREEAWGRIERSSSRKDETVSELRGGTCTHRGPRGSGRAFVTLGKEKVIKKGSVTPQSQVQQHGGGSGPVSPIHLPK